MFNKKDKIVITNNLIEVSRTKTVNFQAVRIAVAFLCPPEVRYSEGFRLAEFLVQSRIEGKYSNVEAEQFGPIYQVVFYGDKIEDYLSTFECVKVARRNGFFELDNNKKKGV